ncbi:hypothetical protein [Candidatus Thioglobus autotrophicus]|nr:hypothetical protein [Candidatus Thioglobus autotrophicus]
MAREEMRFLTHKEWNYFKKFGYVLIESGLESSQVLLDAQKSFKKILAQAESGEYPYFRVYDDYLSKVVNIAGIEMPFHSDILDKRMAALLNSSSLITGVKDIVGEGRLKLDLSRYHTTREDFGHIGNWHRDADVGNSMYLQVSMFLFDEQGLELMPMSHIEKDKVVEEKIKQRSSDRIEGSIYPKCKAGNILFFDPAILHRGICNSFRGNIHFRFSLDNNYEHLEFKNIVEFNQDWIDVLSNKNSIIVSPRLKKYVQPTGVLYFLKKSLKTFVHYVFFFLPYNFFLFRKLHVHPNLKLRKFFYKDV